LVRLTRLRLRQHWLRLLQALGDVALDGPNVTFNRSRALVIFLTDRENTLRY